MVFSLRWAGKACLCGILLLETKLGENSAAGIPPFFGIQSIFFLFC